MKRQDRQQLTLELLMLACALAGFAVNLLLLIRHVVGGGLAGCGGGSSCDELLNSQWSQVFGIPVTGFGVLVYLGLMVSIIAKGWRWVGIGLGLLVGAALWFGWVQAVLIGRFCPWCMTAHGLGLVIAALGGWRLAMEGAARTSAQIVGGSALASVLAISGLQVIGPQPVTHRLDDLAMVVVAPRAAAIHGRGAGRKVGFAGGRKIYNIAAMPHLGRSDARYVMVEYFDYSCTACQTMRGYLDALLVKHPDDLCVVILPIPLDHSCNHSLGADESEHPGSCELARLALALWRVKPEAFAAFHHELLDGISLAAARAKAQALVPPADLAAAMKDPWINELIQADIRDWLAFSSNTRKLPKLLVRDKRILHGLPSGEADFVRVMEVELGL